MKIFRTFSAVAILLLAYPAACTFSETPSDVRMPAVAGAFYPKDPTELSRMIDGFLANVKETAPTGEILGLIVPHAGYIYSGQVAAYGFKLLEGLHYDTVILIGASHHFGFNGASIWQGGNWKTPLGEVEVDRDLAKAIAGEARKLQEPPQSHIPEHDLEVELPFLQKVLKDFKMVPILLGEISKENARILAQAIVKQTAGKKVLIVISTDMSHYHPADIAETMDQRSIAAVKNQDTDAFLNSLKAGECELCGAAAVITMFEISKLLGSADVEILKYAHSGDVTGDRSSVVGYFSAVFIRKSGGNDMTASSSLTKEQKKELLDIARKSATAYVSQGKVLDFNPSDPALKEKKAAFVTLREDGELRGCIGHTTPVEPLYLSVRDNAIAAATEDPRFFPVRENELGKITIEISVLSVPQLVPSAEQVDISKHGVILRKGSRGGVFLPKVAEETGWTKEKFLSELCSQKAGLPDDCWKDPATQIYVFTAEDFSEKDLR